MGIEAAQHETAAVEKYEQRKRAGAARGIEANAQRSARSLDGLLAQPSNLGWRCHQRDAPLALGSRRCNRQCMRRGHTGASVQQHLNLRINGQLRLHSGRVYRAARGGAGLSCYP